MVSQTKKTDKTTKPPLKKLEKSKRSKPKLKELIYSLTAFVLFFVVFVLLISAEQFSEKVTVKPGEPSPLTMLAPYDKDVEYLASYQEKRKIAEDSVATIYKADTNAIVRLNQNLTASFDKIAQAEALALPDQMIAALRGDVIFDKLDDTNLLTLFVGQDFERIRRLSVEAVLNVAESPENGAKTRDEVDGMCAAIREEINKLQIPDSYKVFLESFIGLKITEPTLIIDEAKTKQAKDLAVSRVSVPVKSYRMGEKIVGEGEIISPDIYEALTAFNLIKNKSIAGPLAGIALVTFLGMILFLFYVYRFQKALFVRRNHLILIGIMMTLILGLTRAMLSITISSSNLADLLIFMIPVAWLTMTLTILLNEYVALASGVLIILYMLLMIDPSNAGTRSFLLAFMSILGTFGGIISVSVLKQRTDLARSGLYLAGINIAGILCLCLIMNFTWQSSAVYTMAMAGNGLLCSVLMIGALPWLERAFGITSSVRLLELSDPNNTLLRQMLIDAPGTYHHSIMVGNLAEAAAEQVGADRLLVRVGALYHDIGKLKRPYFFIENQISAENPHDKISPTLSALIIISHVKDGIELAEKYKLPESIKNIIREHHGDSRANYFYIKALTDNPEMDEKTFRYDGPKPMSKESAIVLLADNVEAVVRSHRGNTAGRLKALVYKIIQDKADEGLLSESELTFKDLSVIAASFVKVLSGIFHSRVTYPEMPRAKSADNRKKLVAQAQDTQQEEKQQQNKAGNRQDKKPQESFDSQGAFHPPTDRDSSTNLYPQENRNTLAAKNSPAGDPQAVPDPQANQPKNVTVSGGEGGEPGRGTSAEKPLSAGAGSRPAASRLRGMSEEQIEPAEPRKHAAMSSDRRTYTRRKGHGQDAMPQSDPAKADNGTNAQGRQEPEWHPQRLFFPDNADLEMLQDAASPVQVHKVKRRETHDEMTAQALEYSFDEFAKTVYMTGSRFSLEDSRQGDAGQERPVQPRKPKKQKHTHQTKRRHHKK